MEYTSTSVRDVIGRVIRNTGLSDTSFIENMKEWIPEAMGMMKTRATLNRYWADVEIDFHKGRLPCGLRSIRAVTHHGHRLRYFSGDRNFDGTHDRNTQTVTFVSSPLTISATATTVYDYLITVGVPDRSATTAVSITINGNVLPVNCSLVSGSDLSPLLLILNSLGFGSFAASWSGITLSITTVGSPDTITAFYCTTNSSPNPGVVTQIARHLDIAQTYTKQQIDIRAIESMPDCADTYYTELDYINTSLRCGTVRVYFNALACDSDGFPLIPDNEDYKQAIYWYVRGMMIGAGWNDPVFDYSKCEYRWEGHAKRAVSQIRYPSADEKETIMMNNTRLILSHDSFNTFFDNLANESIG